MPVKRVKGAKVGRSDGCGDSAALEPADSRPDGGEPGERDRGEHAVGGAREPRRGRALLAPQHLVVELERALEARRRRDLARRDARVAPAGTAASRGCCCRRAGARSPSSRRAPGPARRCGRRPAPSSRSGTSRLPPPCHAIAWNHFASSAARGGSSRTVAITSRAGAGPDLVQRHGGADRRPGIGLHRDRQARDDRGERRGRDRARHGGAALRERAAEVGAEQAAGDGGRAAPAAAPRAGARPSTAAASRPARTPTPPPRRRCRSARRRRRRTRPGRGGRARAPASSTSTASTR